MTRRSARWLEAVPDVPDDGPDNGGWITALALAVVLASAVAVIVLVVR
jgi:hypothetical protein